MVLRSEQGDEKYITIRAIFIHQTEMAIAVARVDNNPYSVTLWIPRTCLSYRTDKDVATMEPTEVYTMSVKEWWVVKHWEAQ